MKILHLPNERTNERNKFELTSRTAFESMLASRHISEYHVYSFLFKLRQIGVSAVEIEILDLVKLHQPDVIFWQHISEFNPSDGFYERLKAIAPKALLVYQDEDAYGKWIKPVTKEMRRIISIADLALTSGTGNFIELYRSNGSKKTRYFPHCFDLERSPKLWAPQMSRDIDIVMIGSMFKSKIPGRRLPGANRRKEMAFLISERFKEDFYLYGKGWSDYKLVSAKGLLPFEQQFATLKNSWISINWDHFDKEPCYSSDRLPISMASGTPHITNNHPGYDLMFKECKGGIYFANSPKESVEIATYLLSQSKEFLIEEGKKAFDFVYERYESTVVYRELINFIKYELRALNE